MKTLSIPKNIHISIFIFHIFLIISTTTETTKKLEIIPNLQFFPSLFQSSTTFIWTKGSDRNPNDSENLKFNPVDKYFEQCSILQNLYCVTLHHFELYLVATLKKAELYQILTLRFSPMYLIVISKRFPLALQIKRDNFEFKFTLAGIYIHNFLKKPCVPTVFIVPIEYTSNSKFSKATLSNFYFTLSHVFILFDPSDHSVYLIKRFSREFSNILLFLATKESYRYKNTVTISKIDHICTKLSINLLLKLWDNLNHNWQFANQKSSEYLLPCIHEECLRKIIQKYHNCTSKFCDKFLHLLMHHHQIDIYRSKFDHLDTVQSFGASFHGLKYIIFHQINYKNDLLILLKPVQFLGWVVFMICFIFTAITFKTTGIPKSFWLIIQVTLEKAVRLRINLKFSSLIIIIAWAFGTMCFRSMYSSFLFSDSTISPIPYVPRSFNQLLKEFTDDSLIIANSMPKLMVRSEVKLFSAAHHFPFLAKRNNMKDHAMCHLSNFTEFLEGLLNFREIHCIFHNGSYYVNFETKSRLEKFAIIYDKKAAHLRYAVSMLGNRYTFKNQDNSLEVKINGWISPFRSVFERFFAWDLARLEASGISDYILRVNERNTSIKDIKKAVGNLIGKVKYSPIQAVNKKDWLKDAFDESINQIKPASFESMHIIWILYGFLKFLCVVVWLGEILLGKIVNNSQKIN